MKTQVETYGKHIKNSLAVLLLLLFTTCFVAEAVVYDVNGLFQSELIDFESDHDSEEDTENENKKEKEDKLLCDFHFLVANIIQVTYKSHETESSLNTTTQEVLSPPPELG